MSQLQWNFRLLCDEEMQDVQLENFLLMKQDAPLEEAKQEQSKSKGLEFYCSSIHVLQNQPAVIS